MGGGAASAPQLRGTAAAVVQHQRQVKRDGAHLWEGGPQPDGGLQRNWPNGFGSEGTVPVCDCTADVDAVSVLPVRADIVGV